MESCLCCLLCCYIFVWVRSQHILVLTLTAFSISSFYSLLLKWHIEVAFVWAGIVPPVRLEMLLTIHSSNMKSLVKVAIKQGVSMLF